MASTDYDVVIGGTKAKVLRAEDGGYRKRTLRREVEQQLLSQSENPSLVSRSDQRQLYQTSWAGGSRWWKPLMGPQEADSYFQANHMDVWSEPGKVVPGNQVTDAANTDLHDNCVLVSSEDAVYAIGNTNDTNAAYRDVYKWTPASNAFVRETSYHSHVLVGDHPVSAVYDSNDQYVYVLVFDTSTDGWEVVRFKPGTTDGDDAWLSSASSSLAYGASIVSTQQGLVFSTKAGVALVEKTGPSATTIFTPGPEEALSLPSGGSTLFRSSELMVSSPEGIFYVINSLTGGQYQPWVYRIERDAAGNWIGGPFAPLPVGSVALSVAYHLGSVVIATSPEPQTIIDQTEHAEVVLYQYTDKQPGALGSVLGRGEVDETPYSMLGATGPLLYIGGHKRLWVYDAIRGGLHSAWEWGTTNTLGPYRTMAWVRDSDDDGALIFIGPDRIARAKRNLEDDPDTVTDFGDDETHYQLTSNYFDGGLPLETKELTKVQILHEALDDSGDGETSNQEWTVQISADGGSFSDALTNSVADSSFAEADLSGTTGRRFQYRLIYQTKDTERIPLEGLLVSFTTGEMVTEWDLTLDGAELLNIDNEVQDEEAFYDALVTLANTATITTLVDNMQEQGQETDTGTTTKVKVQAVEINKQKPGESIVRVVLREAA